MRKRLWQRYGRNQKIYLVALLMTLFCITSPAFCWTGAPIAWGNGKIVALFADYDSGNGVWSNDGTSWTRLTDWQSAKIISYGTTGIASSFNVYDNGNGIWLYNGSWNKITDWIPGDMVSYSNGNIAGRFSQYGTGNGVYLYNGSSWSRLTDWQPESMLAIGADVLVGKFSQYGSDNGVYRHNGSSWSRITDWLPDFMISWGSRISPVFTQYGSSGNGVWVYESSSWKRITDWTPSQLVSWNGDAKLAGIFGGHGTDSGVYSYNGTSWSKLTDWVPTTLTTMGTEELIAIFKDYGTSGNGIWKYNATSQSWQRLTDWVPDTVSANGSVLEAVFTNYGSNGNGVWKYASGSWNRQTDWKPKDPDNAPSGMVKLPGGSFQMGDAIDGESDAQPVHTVALSTFYLDKYEVTKSLWDEVYNWATSHGYSFDNAGSGTASNHPVNTVNWYDTVKWLNARSEKAGRTPVYYTDSGQATVYRTGQVTVVNTAVKWTANGYRLPTEAEWEYAARGGTTTRYYTGDCISSDTQANYDGRSSYYGCPTGQYRGDSTAVGTFPANPWGLYDMAGNVAEWPWDMYDQSYYSSSPSSNPHGPDTGSNRVGRDCYWGYSADGLRSAGRHADGNPAEGYVGLGFRSALSQP